MADALAADLPDVYAAAEGGEPSIHEGVNVGCELEVLSVNLMGSPANIPEEAGMIADRMA